jgi:hypothetical protein
MALQLGHAADGTWAHHGGPHRRRRMARAGVVGCPVVGQGEVEMAHMRDEELVALIGGWPPCCADEHPGSVRRHRHDLPRARPPRRFGARDLGARGLGSRGGLRKERDDPEAEGGERTEVWHVRLARAQARPARDVAARRRLARLRATVPCSNT